MTCKALLKCERLYGNSQQERPIHKYWGMVYLIPRPCLELANTSGT
jgi:hypothetical protein